MRLGQERDEQMSLFELKVVALVPARGNGKTCKHNAVAEDGFDYVVKALSDGEKIPSSEWFCYQLAQSVGLSCPQPAVLVLPDGSRAFGSRLETGLAHMADYIKQGISPEKFLSDCAGRLSVAYAMDLFAANIDRHFGNFLFGTNSFGLRTVMPIDYSHAWLVGGWPIKDIHDKANATTNHMEIVRGMGLWRAPEALMALGTISQIRSPSVASWLQQMPSSWMSQVEQDTVVTWWGGEDFHGRVSKCVQACQP